MESAQRVSGRRLLLAFLAWAAAAAALYGALYAASRLGARAFIRGHLDAIGAGFVLAAYLLLFAALAKAFGWRGLRDQLGFRYTRVLHLLLAPPLWFATVFAGALLSEPLSRWLGQPKTNAGQLIAARHDPVAAPLLVFTLVLAAPVCEELLFRGGLYGWLRGRAPLAVAAPASALVFAGAHRFLPLLVLLFAFGLAAAIYYQRTGSTLNTMVMHACQNGAAAIAVYTGAVH